MCQSISHIYLNYLFLSGEALGAIGDPNLRELLEKYQHDPAVEVAETCQIALQRINWIANEESKKEKLSKSLYSSIDPAPPSKEDDVESLKKTLLDESRPLFERYRAMFSLRNLGTTDSINALGEGEFTSENHCQYIVSMNFNDNVYCNFNIFFQVSKPQVHSSDTK